MIRVGMLSGHKDCVPSRVGSIGARGDSAPVTSRNPRPIDALQKFVWGLLIASFPFTTLELWPNRLKTFGEPSVLLAALLGALILGEAALRPRDIFVPKSRSTWLLLAFMVILGLSLFVNYPINPYMWPGHSPWVKGIKQLAQWYVDGFIVYVTVRFVRTWKDFRWALCWVLFGLLLTGASALVEVAAMHSAAGTADAIYSFLHNGGMEHTGRLNLLAYEPSMAGDYLLSVLPLLVCGSFYWRSRWWKVAWSFLALLLFCMTFSLGAFAALFAAAILIGIVCTRRGARGMIAGVLLLLSILAAATVSSARGERFLGNRISGILESGFDPSRIPDFSTRGRLAAAEAAFNIFLNHPVMGVGVGKSPFYMYGAYPAWALNQGDITTAAFWSLDNPSGAISYNLFIEILADTGVVGAIAFGALLLSMLADCYGALSAASDRWKRAAFAGILFALVAQIIHYNAMCWLGMRYWFFIWGLAICAPALLKQTDARMPTRRALSRNIRATAPPAKRLCTSGEGVPSA